MVQAQEGTQLSRADFISGISTAEVPWSKGEGTHAGTGPLLCPCRTLRRWGLA